MMGQGSFVRCLVVGVLATAAQGESPQKPLPPKHLKAGVICHDCHRKENPSMAAVADESCGVCHGDAPAMAAYTKNRNPNPHNPPPNPQHKSMACTECHHQHRPAEVKCLGCHPTFKLTAR